MELYQIKNLTFTYPLAAAPALNDISLTVQQGEFVTICGASGCGKTTFLRHLKPVLTPHGTKKGELLFSGISLAQMDPGTQAAEIGFVLQTPDSQIVTDKVWHELAFGLESLGYDNPTIRLRVAEMASFFGIQHWFSKDVNALSGGEKQLLNLASVMAMQPSVLILDEPTSQLDPIAAADFLETVQKINRALGTTIILTEHRLEEVLPMSDRVLVLDKGKIIADDTPQAVGEALKKQNHPMFFAMPVPMRVYAGVKSSLPCPVTVRDGRKWLDSLPLHKSAACRKPSSSSVSHTASVRHAKKSADPPAVRLKDVWFKYDKNLPDTIKGLSLEVNQGQLYCILGGNGTGKTTALSIIQGTLTPYRGKVYISGRDMRRLSALERLQEKTGMLPQNPQLLFVQKTLELDLLETLDDPHLSGDQKTEKMKNVVSLCQLDGLLQMHPYDLSGGEQQRAALAKVLLTEPNLLLLDEPTKGLDGFFKRRLASILKALTARGVTILMVSHDLEFCARYADICALFFDGDIVTQQPARAFFSGNSFYTTAANRMARHLFPNAITAEDVIHQCKTNL